MPELTPKSPWKLLTMYCADADRGATAAKPNPPEFTTYVPSSAERGADRCNQLVASGVFQDVSQRPGLQARLDEHRFGMHRHEHDPSVRIVAADQPGGRDAVDPGHRNIGDDDVR